MQTTSNTQNTPTFTPESLALSASLFTSSIDAWIPADFGVKRSNEEMKKDFDRILSSAVIEDSDRLGVGHPSLEIPRASQPRGASLGVLGKRLGKARREAGNGIEEQISGLRTGVALAAENGDEEEEEEADSRSRSIGKGKRKANGAGHALDLFSGKKKAKKIAKSDDPALIDLEPPISSRPGAAIDLANGSTHQHAKLPDSTASHSTPDTPPILGETGAPALPSKLALHSGHAKRALIGDTAHGPGASPNEAEVKDDDRDSGGVAGEEVMKLSKNQLRREKRKRKKVADRLDREEAES